MRADFVIATWAALGAMALGCHAGAAAVDQDANVSPPSYDAGAADARAEAGIDGGSVRLGQVDRAGRPLVAVLMVPPSRADDYNAASTFDAPLPRTLQDALSSRLQVLDTLEIGDGGPDPVDWPLAAAAHPLVAMLATDVLLVDTSLSCATADGGFAASYLDIEREIFPDIFSSGAVHTTCGGRTPSDPVVDTTWTLLVTRGRSGAPPVGQGVAGPTRPPTMSFPYLAPPNAN